MGARCGCNGGGFCCPYLRQTLQPGLRRTGDLGVVSHHFLTVASPLPEPATRLEPSESRQRADPSDQSGLHPLASSGVDCTMLFDQVSDSLTLDTKPDLLFLQENHATASRIREIIKGLNGLGTSINPSSRLHLGAFSSGASLRPQAAAWCHFAVWAPTPNAA